MKPKKLSEPFQAYQGAPILNQNSSLGFNANKKSLREDF